MKTISNRRLRIVGSILLLGVAVPVLAFELLSEGAMDSVSAVSVESSEEIINVMGSTSAGLRVEEGYEQLPLVEEGVTLEGYSVEDNSAELELTLSKEVEVWAESVREGASLGVTEFKVGYVDQLPPSIDSEFRAPTFDSASAVDFDAFVVSSDGETIFQIGRVNQTFALIDSGVDSITYGLKRFIERTSTEIIDPRDDRAFIGSAYVTNLTSESRVRIAGTRD